MRVFLPYFQKLASIVKVLFDFFYFWSFSVLRNIFANLAVITLTTVHDLNILFMFNFSNAIIGFHEV